MIIFRKFRIAISLFSDRITENKYLVIDINNLDFVSNEGHFNQIIETIFGSEYTNGLNMIIL